MVKPPLISSGSLANFDIQKERSSIWVERIVTLIYDFGLSTFLTTLRVITKPNNEGVKTKTFAITSGLHSA
jgi:hypothetical protein